VLREAIVNALMHRSYRIHGAIQIIRYSNRLEIRNPGHSLKPEEQLGEPGSQTRNPRIAAVLHDVHLAETKGSGIRAMTEVMLKQDLLPPTFESSPRPDHFVATFHFHHFLGEADRAWLRALTYERLSDEEARALLFVREAGAIDNAAYRSINRVEMLDASGHLRRLRELRLLERKGSGNRTYYIASPTFRDALAGAPEGYFEYSAAVSRTPGLNKRPGSSDPHQFSTDPHQPSSDPHQSSSDPHHLHPDPHHLHPDPHHLHPDPHQPIPATREDTSSASTAPRSGAAPPPELASRLANAGPGKRPRKGEVRCLIEDLCTWRPLSAREIAGYLGNRDPKQLVREHLAPMIDKGELTYVFPEMPNHPEQKYKVLDS